MTGARLQEAKQGHPRVNVIIAGPARSGKSNIQARLIGDGSRFSEDYIPTAAAQPQPLTWSEPRDRLPNQPQLAEYLTWDLLVTDLPGGERYHDVVTGHYQRLDQGILVAVVDGSVPLLEADRIRLLEGARQLPANTPRILVINKMIGGAETKEAHPDSSKRREFTPIDVAELSLDLGVEDEDVVYTSAKTESGIDRLNGLIFQKTKQIAYPTLAASSKASPCANLPLRQGKVVAGRFVEAIAALTDNCPALKSRLTHDDANNLKEYLNAASISIQDDLEQGRITYSEALRCAKAAKVLAMQVASQEVTKEDIVKFRKAAQPVIEKSTRTGRIMGAIIGAALGVFLGVMIGAFAPPAGAFAALALGKIGVVAGAAVGGAVFTYVGSKISLWRDPLVSVESAAKQVEKKKRKLSV